MENEIHTKEHYVYLLLDPRKGVSTPFYVGKGKGRRIEAHFNPSSRRKGRRTLKDNVIDAIRSAGMNPLAVKVCVGMSDRESRDLERALIARYGRRDLGEGILTNHTDGGDGANRPSPENLEKLRQRMTGAGSPTYGVGHTDEARARMSASQKERVEKGLVTRHSDEHKQRMREDNAGGRATRKRVLKMLPDATVVETFESMTEAALSVRRTKANFGWETVKDGSLPLGGFFYRYENSVDIAPSGIINADDLITQRIRADRGAGAGKPVEHTVNGLRTVYESIKEASRAFPEINYATLWSWIKQNKKGWKYD